MNVHHLAEINLADASKYAALSIAFLCALCLGYTGPLQSYAYMPGYIADFSWGRFFVSMVCVLVTAIILPRRAQNNGVLFLWLIMYLVLIPIAAVYACSDRDIVVVAGSFITFVAAAWIGTGIRQHGTAQGIVSSYSKAGRGYSAARKTGDTVAALCTMVCVAALLYAIAKRGIPSLDALKLEEVYEIRALNAFSGAENALFQLIGLMVIPLLLTFYIFKGKLAQAVFITAIDIALYLITANKVWVLLVILIWGLRFFSKFKISITKVLLYCLTFVFAITVAAILFPDIFLAAYSILVRRLLILPAILGYDYHMFFQDHSLVGMQGTLIGMLLPDNPDYASISYQVLISHYTFGSGDAATYANTGLYGGEFANFGIAAWLIIPMNIVILIRFFSVSASTAVGKQYQFVSTIIVAFLLLNMSSIRLMYSAIGLCFFVLMYILFRALDVNMQTLGAQHAVSSELSQWRSSHNNQVRSKKNRDREDK